MLPDIILIDGGKHQLEAAMGIFLTIPNEPPIILSIVKGSKRVRATETILSKDGIIEMPKDSPGFILLQQVRDESHRFAISANRRKKNKRVRFSSLDDIYGIGPQKKKKLLNHFKSLQSIRNASIEELCQLDGISIRLGNEIKKQLS